MRNIAADVWRIVGERLAPVSPARRESEAEEPDRIAGQAHPRETYALDRPGRGAGPRRAPIRSGGRRRPG